MAGPFGVTPEGFVLKTIEDIVDELEADELSEIADDLDVSAESIPGQFNGIFGRQLAIGWELAEDIHNGGDPDAAEDRQLDMLSKLTGTFRRGSTASEVILTCDLDAGTVLTAGETFAAIEDKEDIRWTPKTTYTAATSGLQPVTFVCEQLGPVEGLAGTITVMSTTVVGWHSVVNADDAEKGIEVDSNAVLRARREKELATLGSATVRAIAAKLEEAFTDRLEALIVYENEDDVTDADGRPPHSIEALIFDGVVPSIADADIAQAIWDAKAGGIQTHGNITSSVTIVEGGVERAKPVKFSRATQVAIYLEIDVVPAAGYPGDDEVAKSVIDQANERFQPGRDVAVSALSSFPFVFPGVENVTAVRVGTTPSPVGTVDIPIDVRSVARFSTARIVVNSS